MTDGVHFKLKCRVSGRRNINLAAVIFFIVFDFFPFQITGFLNKKMILTFPPIELPGLLKFFSEEKELLQF